MKKPLITALVLLATSAAAQAMPPECTPASGNWVNAAPTTCRFINRDTQQEEPRERVSRQTPPQTSVPK